MAEGWFNTLNCVGTSLCRDRFENALLWIVDAENAVRSYPLDTMAVDEFVSRLINDDHSLHVMDFRPAAE